MAYDNYNARVARTRGSIYAFLTEAFIRLPNEEYLRHMKSPGTLKFLENLKNLNSKKMKSGIINMQNYLKLLEGEGLEAGLESMAVDRTSLIRPVQKGRLKAPYEGQYNKKENANTVILNVKKFYKRAGILPDSTDSVDFFCTELDFMRQLCIIGIDGDAENTRVLEREFIHTHIGSWIGDYCAAAIPLARTDFYKGLLMFLDGFIELEKQC